MPNGTAIKRVSSVTTIVLIIAGIQDTFSLLYSQANNSGVRCGIPITRIYTIKNIRARTENAAASTTRISNTSERGFLLYSLSL